MDRAFDTSCVKGMEEKKTETNEGGECEKEETGIFIFIFHDIRGICGVLVASARMGYPALRNGLCRDYFI